jgi:hypothetical protein
MNTKRDLDEIFRVFLSGPWLLLSALALIAVIVLSAVLRLPHATVDLSVDAMTVQFTATAPIEAQINVGLGPESSVDADNVSVNLNDLGCSIRQTPNGFHIQGELTLSQLVLESGARLKVERSDNGAITFDFSGGGTIRLTAARGLRISEGNDNTHGCSRNAEGLLIEIRPLDPQAAGGRESRVRLSPAWQPEGASLRIGREEPGSELLPVFTSTIAEGGKIRVLETDREASLREGDPVRFDGLTGEILELTIDRRKIHQRVVGYARSIRVRCNPKSFQPLVSYHILKISGTQLDAEWLRPRRA